MASAVTEKVFEKKYSKLKVFLSLTFKYGVYMAVIYVLLYWLSMNMGLAAPGGFAMEWCLRLSVVAVLGIIFKMVMEKDVSVTVMSKTVDITVGDLNYNFPVTDYVGPHLKKSGKKEARFELVFVDQDDRENNKHIESKRQYNKS